MKNEVYRLGAAQSIGLKAVSLSCKYHSASESAEYVKPFLSVFWDVFLGAEVFADLFSSVPSMIESPCWTVVASSSAPSFFAMALRRSTMVIRTPPFQYADFLIANPLIAGFGEAFIVTAIVRSTALILNYLAG